MCGIVGYIGENKCQKVLVKGLSHLEYRGYDSSGIALINNGEFILKKVKGRLVNLENKLTVNDDGVVGIGHTRWATHGKPSDENSHPHRSDKGNFCVVHNGIIENFQELKERLIKDGVIFASETDTEVIPNLLEENYDGNLLTTVQKTLGNLEGAYALGIINKNHPKEMVVVRKASPLIIGTAKDGFYVASDIPAILEYTKDVYILEEDEVAHIKDGKILFYNKDEKEIKKKITTIDWNLESAQKQGYDHFMLKEINEQPEAIEKTLVGKIKDGKVNLNLSFQKEFIKSVNKIAIVACGTASYAGRVGGHLIEQYLRIPVEAEFASEFRYKDPIIDKNTLVIVISQSGETADTLAGLREAKDRGAGVLAITNVVGSSISREADHVIYTQAGPEIAVASTKAYITQLIALYLLVIELGKARGVVSEKMESNWVTNLHLLPKKVSELLGQSENIKKFAQKIKDCSSAFFLGRGIDNLTALEGALKLKEISYIHAESYASGELKHGTLALIDEGVPVIAVATQRHLLEKSVSNVIEVKARGAYTFAVGFADMRNLIDVVDEYFVIPEIIEPFAPTLSVIPLQLLSYYTSVLKGNDVDKPRNLAKSVTVE